MGVNGLPAHVAIIMDGNGRWARQRHLPRTRGHLEGIKRVDEIVAVAARMGIKVLTLYAFSTENWSRSKKEISTLMKAFVSALDKKAEAMRKNNIRLHCIGQRTQIPREVLRHIDAAMRRTADNTGLVLNIAFNYGARREITDAVKKIAGAIQRRTMTPDDITEQTVSDALYTAGLPDPDLLIRTSGDQRISNFLLWQLSYTELYFTEKYWPEFTEKEFQRAIADFQKRERRYGRTTAVKQ